MKTAKQIPQTTVQACAKYHARRWTCTCPDFSCRGGSYRDDNGDKVCKHILHIRKEFRLGNQVASSSSLDKPKPAIVKTQAAAKRPTVDELFAMMG